MNVDPGWRGIKPVATYLLSTTADAVDFTLPLTVETIEEPTPKLWGDAVGELVGTVWQAPNGVTNITDAFAAIFKFQERGSIPPLSWVDIHPEMPKILRPKSDDVFQPLLEQWNANTDDRGPNRPSSLFNGMVSP